MTQAAFEIMRLGRKHNRVDFRCGEEALDGYLRLYAWQDAQRGAAGVFVAVAPGSNNVLGFYCLSAYALDFVDLPEEMQKKLPRYGKVPAVLLGRLAVHQDVQGQKLGQYLLMDALHRSLLSDIGWMVFLVQAKHERAAAFYRYYDFQPFSHNPLALFIGRKTAGEVCLNSDIG